MLTSEERAKLIGKGLGQATDDMVAAIGTDAFRDALRDFLAELLGRATSLAAGAIVAYNDRLAAIEKQAAALDVRQAVTEARQRTHAEKITDYNLRLNGSAEQIGKLLDWFEPGGGADLQAQEMYRLSTKVEALEKQVGGDGAAE